MYASFAILVLLTFLEDRKPLTCFCSFPLQEGLSVGKDLQIEQSLEDLEAEFEPGAKFRFDAVVQFQDLK